MSLISSLKRLLDQALVSEYGIVIKLPTPYDAKYQRRRLYAERERLREAGHGQYDGLSFLIRNGQELMIVLRTALSDTKKTKFLECRSLSASEIPDKILSRGKSRPSNCIF